MDRPVGLAVCEARSERPSLARGVPRTLRRLPSKSLPAAVAELPDGVAERQEWRVRSVLRAHDGMCRGGSSSLAAKTRQRSSASKSDESPQGATVTIDRSGDPGFHIYQAFVTIYSAFVTKPFSISSASEAVPLGCKAPMLRLLGPRRRRNPPHRAVLLSTVVRQEDLQSRRWTWPRRVVTCRLPCPSGRGNTTTGRAQPRRPAAIHRPPAHSPTRPVPLRASHMWPVSLMVSSNYLSFTLPPPTRKMPPIDASTFACRSHAMPCRASHLMPCRAVPCRAVPCRAVPCRFSLESSEPAPATAPGGCSDKKCGCQARSNGRRVQRSSCRPLVVSTCMDRESNV